MHDLDAVMVVIIHNVLYKDIVHPLHGYNATFFLLLIGKCAKC